MAAVAVTAAAVVAAARSRRRLQTIPVFVDVADAKVRLQISQQAVITRNAFDGVLDITNNSGGPLNNVHVNLTFTDLQGNDASAAFFSPSPHAHRLQRRRRHRRHQRRRAGHRRQRRRRQLSLHPHATPPRPRRPPFITSAAASAMTMPRAIA